MYTGYPENMKGQPQFSINTDHALGSLSCRVKSLSFVEISKMYANKNI